jgi:uncharacterized protein
VQRFEWDPNKERINRRKHGIGFEEAEAVFDDANLLLEDDRYVDGEFRVQAIGFSGNLILLTVSHTVRNEESTETVIRIISARKADKHEYRRYGESLSRSI